jgi:hypothetical protein
VHDMRCENAHAARCRCECDGTRHGATSDPLRQLDHRPTISDTFCLHCGQPLSWDAGWVHPEGGMYMLQCYRCHHHWAPPRYADRNADIHGDEATWHKYWSCPACGADHTQVADHHTATPTHYSYRRRRPKRASGGRKRRTFGSLFMPTGQGVLSAGGED